MQHKANEIFMPLCSLVSVQNYLFINEFFLPLCFFSLSYSFCYSPMLLVYTRHLVIVLKIHIHVPFSHMPPEIFIQNKILFCSCSITQCFSVDPEHSVYKFINYYLFFILLCKSNIDSVSIL